MKRIRATLLTASAVAALVIACNDGWDGGGSWGRAGGGRDAMCAQYTSCGTCTPVEGCGWCYLADGTGACADGPDDCTGASFAWTWEPTGCRMPADAGVSPSDASTADAPLALDASPDVASPDASADAASPDAALH